jgi:hypothetical protein
LPPLSFTPKKRALHAGIVHHQQVARLQQVDDVGELAVDDLRRRPDAAGGGAALRQRNCAISSCGKLKSKSESEYMRAKSVKNVKCEWFGHRRYTATYRRNNTCGTHSQPSILR